MELEKMLKGLALTFPIVREENVWDWPSPRAEIMPIPDICTLEFLISRSKVENVYGVIRQDDYVWFNGMSALLTGVFVYVICQGVYGLEDLPSHFHVLNIQSEVPLEKHDDFYGIERVQSQTLIKQGLAVLDVFRSDVFQGQIANKK